MTPEDHRRGTLAFGCACFCLARLRHQAAAHARRDSRSNPDAHQLALTNPWKAAPVSTDAIQDNWLATFGDAQLDALVAEAMTNNPDLRVTATRVEQAAQYVELAKAALRPAVNLFGTGGLNMGGGDVSSALQGLSLGVSWEPDLWGRMRYGRNAVSGHLRFGAGRFRVRPAIPGGHDGQELVHRQRDLAAAPDCRGHGQGRAGIGDACGETPAGRPGQRTGRRAGARQPWHLSGHGETSAARA